MAAFLRGNRRNAIGEPARLLIAPIAAPLPAAFSHIVSTSTYDPNPTYQFVDIGMTRSALTMTVQADSNQWDSQQFTRYATVPTNRWATISSEALELTQANKVYLMGASAATPVGAKELRSDFSADPNFVNYRLAAIHKDRFGLLHASVFPNVYWDGSAISQAFARGEQAVIPFTFTGYPDDGAISATTGEALFRYDFDQIE